MSYDRDDVFAEPQHVTPQQQEYAIQRRLEVAQRMAEALREILRVHADDNKRPKAFYIADAALAEWEKTK